MGGPTDSDLACDAAAAALVILGLAVPPCGGGGTPITSERIRRRHYTAARASCKSLRLSARGQNLWERAAPRGRMLSKNPFFLSYHKFGELHVELLLLRHGDGGRHSLLTGGDVSLVTESVSC